MRRIALRTLLHDRARLVAALSGVIFATVLMLVQVGVYLGFRDSASMLVTRLGGEVWITSRGAASLNDGETLARGSDARARAHPCVRRVRPLVMGWADYRRGGGGLDTLQMVGLELDGPTVVPWSLTRGLPADLRLPDRISLDVTEAAKVRIDRDLLGSTLEVSGQMLHIAALTSGIRSVVLVPVVFASADTARRVLGVSDGQATAWIVDLYDRACIPAVVRVIEHDPDLQAHPAQVLAKTCEDDVIENSGVGLALAFVALLGFVIAAVIVGQTLYAITNEHRRELATLKALGARRGELCAFVAWQTAFLGGVGGSIGTACALLIGHRLTGPIAILMPPGAVAIGLSAVAAMCVLSAAASVRKVLALEAASVLE